MPISKLNIDELLKLQGSIPVLDVRSPAEYLHAHIPGALSFSIFSNEERKVIGTAYKQESREKAIKIGLNSFGKNMVTLVEEAEKIISATKDHSRELIVHCWRGGMRSAAIAWLLDLYGFKVHLLTGGYKTYRTWALKQFEKNYPLYVLGGCTGGNKTGVIHELLKKQEPAIDLEGLASHKGSAFGGLGLPAQPSQEQFENSLALELFNQSQLHQNKAMWVEAESQRIGNLNIPVSFYKNMRSQPLFFLDIPFEQRLSHISGHYGKFEKEKLINAIVRIKKKLGGLETKNAVNALLEDDVIACFSVLLSYYDKLYLKSTQSTEEGQRAVHTIASNSIDAKLNTEKLIDHVNNRKF